MYVAPLCLDLDHSISSIAITINTIWETKFFTFYCSYSFCYIARFCLQFDDNEATCCKGVCKAML